MPPRLFISFFSGTFTFFKYFLAFEVNLCIMPLFMQFYGGSLCPAAIEEGLSDMGGWDFQRLFEQKRRIL
jgi:hypothetical protein